MERVERASAVLFGGFDPRHAPGEVVETLAQEIPVTTTDHDQPNVADLLVATGLSRSKGDARRSMQQGGIYVNQQRLEADRTLTSDDWLAGGYVLLRRGNKSYALVNKKA